jgi:glycosyltransferase involved in cell wall biosynthesis
MPSVGYEVFGMVLLEALSVSTPVIARDLGALPEVVEESGGGITFRTDDELVAALRALHASPDLRRTLGDAGHHAYLTKWTEAIHLDTYLHIVQDELARKAEARGRASRS